MVQSGAGGRTRAAAEQRDLAKVPATRQVRQHQFAAGTLLRNLHKADADKVEAVGRISLAANYLPRIEAQQLHAITQMVDEVLGERFEYRHAAQVRVERAGAVVALQLRTEGFVALQDVEYVAQHFEHYTIGPCAYRRRPRVIAHASHF